MTSLLLWSPFWCVNDHKVLMHNKNEVKMDACKCIIKKTEQTEQLNFEVTQNLWQHGLDTFRPSAVCAQFLAACNWCHLIGLRILHDY